MFWAFLLGLRLFLLTRHERYTISNVKYNLEVAFRVIKVNAQFKCISKNISSRFSIQPSMFLFGSKTHVYLHVHVKNKIFLQLTYNQYNHFFKLKRILSVLQDRCLKKKKLFTIPTCPLISDTNKFWISWMFTKMRSAQIVGYSQVFHASSFLAMFKI